MRQHPIWARAITRLMTVRQYRSQAALISAARKRGIRLRPNTLSDALNMTKTTRPRLDTLEAIAQALEVPLWALCCEEAEYHLFLGALQARDRSLDAELFHKLDEVTALIRARQVPIESSHVPIVIAEGAPRKRRQA